jgi:hypothetical protein
MHSISGWMDGEMDEWIKWVKIDDKLKEQGSIR